MTYLDRLEQELIRAGYREPRRVWPARTAITLATAAATTALVLAVPTGPPPAERPVASPSVEAVFGGAEISEDVGARELGVRVRVIAREPVTVAVTATSGEGEPVATTSGPGSGDIYADLELMPLGAVGLEVRVTDADGNEQVFRPAATPPTAVERYADLRDSANLVPPTTPAIPLPAGSLGPNPEIHEVRDFRGGKAWIALGNVVCVGVRFPADGGGSDCWDDLRAAATPKVHPEFIAAVVPDGTTDASVRYPFGDEEVPIVGNLLYVAPRHPVLAVSYRAPDGTLRNFPLG